MESEGLNTQGHSFNNTVRILNKNIVHYTVYMSLMQSKILIGVTCI